MKRPLRHFLCATCLTCLSGIPFAAAQNAAKSASSSSNVVGTRLIVWSEFQKPKPLGEGASAAPVQTSETEPDTTSYRQKVQPTNQPKEEDAPAGQTHFSSSTIKLDSAGR